MPLPCFTPFPAKSTLPLGEQGAKWKSFFVKRKSIVVREQLGYSDYVVALNNDDPDLATATLDSIQAELELYKMLEKEDFFLSVLCREKGVELYGASDRGDCLPVQCVLALTTPVMRGRYSSYQYQDEALKMRLCAVDDMRTLIRQRNTYVIAEVLTEMRDVLCFPGGLSAELFTKALRERWGNTLHFGSTVADYEQTITANQNECMEIYLSEILAKQSTYAMRTFITIIAWILHTFNVRLTIYTVGSEENWTEPPKGFHTSYVPTWQFDTNIDIVDLFLMFSTAHYLALLRPHWLRTDSNVARNEHIVSVIPHSFFPPPRNPYAQSLHPLP
jgi:hypothetical protein